jgi:hypothetical protein
MTANGGLALPSERTIAQIERGHRLLENVAAAGAAHDTQTMNGEARVGIRELRCSATGPDSATCSYETNGCTTAQSDTDGEEWCARTSKFIRVDNPRGIGDVIADGWGLRLE